MTSWGAVALAIVGSLIAFEMVGRLVNRRGTRTTVGRIGASVGMVARGGTQGTVLSIKCPCTKHRIELRKLGAPESPTGFEWTLAARDRSDSLLARAKQVLKNSQVESRVSGSGRAERLTILVEPNLPKAIEVAQLLLTDVLGLSEHDQVRAGTRGPLDLTRASHGYELHRKLGDGPGYPRPPQSAGSKGASSSERTGATAREERDQDEFRFESQVELSEEEYLAIYAAPVDYPRLRPHPIRRIPRLLRITVIALVGTACLMSKYTVPLGILLIGLAFLGVFGRQVTRAWFRREYRKSTYLHGVAHHGVDQEQVWVRSPHLELRAPWEDIECLRVRAGWIVLNTHTSGLDFTVMLPASDVRRQGLYEVIIAREQPGTRPSYSVDKRPSRV